MKIASLILFAGFATFISTAALAATALSIKDAPDATAVTLNGTVEDFDSEHSFMLRDSSGTVKIDLTSTKPMVLKDGEMIAVTGHVHHTILGTDVIVQQCQRRQGSRAAGRRSHRPAHRSGRSRFGAKRDNSVSAEIGTREGQWRG